MPADRNFWDRAFEAVVTLLYDGGGTDCDVGVACAERDDYARIARGVLEALRRTPNGERLLAASSAESRRLDRGAAPTPEERARALRQYPGADPVRVLGRGKHRAVWALTAPPVAWRRVAGEAESDAR